MLIDINYMFTDIIPLVSEVDTMLNVSFFSVFFLLLLIFRLAYIYYVVTLVLY